MADMERVKTISVDIPEHGLSSALAGMKLTMGLDLPLNTSKSGIIRAALAMIAGKSTDEIRNYATGSATPNLGSGGKYAIGAQVPEDLLDDAKSAMTGNSETSYTVRVGLAMLAGFTREQAEAWAHMKRGRPSKRRSDDA